MNWHKVFPGGTEARAREGRLHRIGEPDTFKASTQSAEIAKAERVRIIAHNNAHQGSKHHQHGRAAPITFPTRSHRIRFRFAP